MPLSRWVGILENVLSAREIKKEEQVEEVNIHENMKSIRLQSGDLSCV